MSEDETDPKFFEVGVKVGASLQAAHQRGNDQDCDGGGGDCDDGGGGGGDQDGCHDFGLYVPLTQHNESTCMCL